MKSQQLILALAVAGVLGAAGYGLYRLGLDHGQHQQTAAPAAGTQRKVLYWHDPMVPGQRFDKPGKSPFMDMQLVPVYADEAGEAGDEGKVSISPRMQQNLGVRTTEAVIGELASAVEAVGSVAYNEREVALVQARSNGFVERLHARAPLDRVRKGQPLAELYVPDWVAAQEEYLSVRRMGSASGADGLLDGARQRMRLAGMSEEQIRRVDAAGKVQPRMTVTAPATGVITELGAREGMTVMAGATLFRINGLGTVWVNAELPENLAALVRPGDPVQARSAALPGTVFNGRIGALLPDVDPATRTLKARIELANPAGRLVPGMFVNVSLRPAARSKVVLVPSEAVIQTGARSVVMTALEGGRFQPVDVETGAEANGQTEIRKGLTAGQKIVVSGQFLIDSDASLKSSAMRMGEPPATGGKPAALTTHRGTGRIENIDKGDITISHGPIPSLQWGPMTMDFKAPPQGMPVNVAVGGMVAFEFHAAGDGVYQLSSVTPLADQAAPVKQPAQGGGK